MKGGGLSGPFVHGNKGTYTISLFSSLFDSLNRDQNVEDFPTYTGTWAQTTQVTRTRKTKGRNVFVVGEVTPSRPVRPRVRFCLSSSSWGAITGTLYQTVTVSTFSGPSVRLFVTFLRSTSTHDSRGSQFLITFCHHPHPPCTCDLPPCARLSVPRTCP